jgi:hypothetical protein
MPEKYYIYIALENLTGYLTVTNKCKRAAKQKDLKIGKKSIFFIGVVAQFG